MSDDFSALPRFSHYDVVIIGAGMVGATLASALLLPPQPNARILLIEATTLQRQQPQQPGFDTRSTVLSASSVDYLQQLGLWAALQSRAAPITHIQVSDQGHLGGVDMQAAESQLPALGYVVENPAIGQALNEALLASRGIELCSPLHVTAVQPHVSGMQLQVATSAGAPAAATLTASLVVLADGGRSGLAGRLGIHREERRYAQSAIIANLALAAPHGGSAYERFTAKGPLALLPLLPHEGRQRMALVWTQPDDEAAAVLDLPQADFLARLQRDFGQRAGQIVDAGKRVLYPLTLQVAEEQFRPGLVLLGNVAHTLHPVAGQGFNLALRDAMALAANLRQSLAEGSAVGSPQRLAAWWEQVRQDQQRTILFSDWMTRLFSSNAMALSLLRKAGMLGLELLPPLKREFTRQALGYQAPRARL